MGDISDASILGIQFRYDNDTILTNYRDIDIVLNIPIIKSQCSRSSQLVSLTT